MPERPPTLPQPGQMRNRQFFNAFYSKVDSEQTKKTVVVGPGETLEKQALAHGCKGSREQTLAEGLGADGQNQPFSAVSRVWGNVVWALAGLGWAGSPALTG